MEFNPNYAYKVLRAKGETVWTGVVVGDGIRVTAAGATIEEALKNAEAELEGLPVKLASSESTSTPEA